MEHQVHDGLLWPCPALKGLFHSERKTLPVWIMELQQRPQHVSAHLLADLYLKQTFGNADTCQRLCWQVFFFFFKQSENQAVSLNVVPRAVVPKSVSEALQPCLDLLHWCIHQWPVWDLGAGVGLFVRCSCHM